MKHDYNRDGDSYRSPFSNQFYPASPDATFFPSEELLKIEKKANDLWSTYVHLYYDFAISSVYFVDSDEKGFNAAYLVKKQLEGQKEVKNGCWDGIHIVTC